MRFRLIGTAIAVLAFSVPFFAQQISGDYVETRSADCLHRPVLREWGGKSGRQRGYPGMAHTGWKLEWCRPERIHRGSSSPRQSHSRRSVCDPYPARSVLLVDDQANLSNRQHWQRLPGIWEESCLTMPISVAGADGVVVNHERHGVAMLRAGRFATVQTRSLNDTDHLCGNEETSILR